MNDERRGVVRPDFRPAVEREGREAGTFVLRDGNAIGLLRALPEDARLVQAFLGRLPDDERLEVERSLRLSGDAVEGFLRGVTGGEGEAFLVRGDEGPDLLAFGGYRLLPGGDAAALGLAVQADRRGLGIGALLLERVALLAALRGVRTLVGVAHVGNTALSELFRGGGFEAETTREGDYDTYRFDTRVPAPTDLGARIFATSSLRPVFRPRSVAVVGASRRHDSVGYRILVSLVRNGFEGPVYPVNPKSAHVGSIRAYPDLRAIGAPVDLVIIAVPAEHVPAVVEECAAVGARGLVVVTAGFAETGPAGKARQDALVDQVRRHGMRMIGPNCLGFISTDPEVRLNATFTDEMPPRGTVGLCSQSGALGVAIIALARRLGLGLSSFASVGNKADVSGNDLLEYWEEDPSTDVVMFYLESFGQPRKFARIARRVGRRKPIVAVKAGRSEAGRAAASSHTAALAAAETAVDALFRQTGIIRADTLQEMFGIARALTKQPLPRGRRVAVVTNSGGPAILCTDALEAAGLRVEALGDETRAALARFLPPEASTRNPVDMIASADPEAYRRAVERVLCADEVDALIVIYTPVGMYDTDAVRAAVALGVDAAGAPHKPVFACVIGGDAETYAIETPRGTVVPAYEFPEEMGRVLGKIAEYAEWRRADPGTFPEFPDQRLAEARRICREALEARGPGWLTAQEARAVLECAGLSLPPGGVATSADEAARIAAEVGFPVAVKLVSLAITHKTEHGGVVLNLRDADAVRAAFDDMRGRLGDAMQGALVQPMVKGAAEVMIGVEPDPVFGPLVAFGLGGIHVEILRDVVFRVSPLTDKDAREMVSGIRGFPLLQGYRGHPAADVPALREALLRVSSLVDAVPELGAIDMNPVMALEPGRGYRIIDARVAVR